MSWVDALHEPRSIRGVFGAFTPSLDGVVLHEIRLHRDGPSVYLRFDFREFPTDPPRKWGAVGYNTVQVELCLYAVESVEVSELSTVSVIDLNISTIDRNGKVAVRAWTSGNSTTRLNVVAGSVSVAKVSAYKNDPPPPDRSTSL
ncbi:Imm50 family immunity protein [Nocardia sp. NPDC058518]|uniref:Imm50 family immunity protein n=1 Tax=Nocardia sp. NPDC058518 TaxID=3346534 RepID=UPI0036607902